MIKLFDRTISGLLFVQLVLKCWEFCGAATWIPGRILLVVHTMSIFKLAKCKVLSLNPNLDNYEVLDLNLKMDKLVEYKLNDLIPYLDNYEVLDSNPERDKLAKCKVNGSSPYLKNYEVLDSNSKSSKLAECKVNV